jgi:hypothetical protein
MALSSNAAAALIKFVDTQCEKGKDYLVSARELREAFNKWFTGRPVRSFFQQSVVDLGYVYKVTGYGSPKKQTAVYEGIRLKQAAEQAPVVEEENPQVVEMVQTEVRRMAIYLLEYRRCKGQPNEIDVGGT